MRDVLGLRTPTLPCTFNLRANFLNTTLPGWSLPLKGRGMPEHHECAGTSKIALVTYTL